MLSDNSSEEVNLHFLKPANGVNEASNEMKMAYQECLEAKLDPKWINEDDAIKLTDKTDVIVIDNFEGKVFNHLKQQKCVICGPICLRTCLVESSQIPETNSPVFITSMRGLVVTATNITGSLKSHIKEKVSYMGGVYTNNLVESVTHLICGGVQSDKYDKATERGISIMTRDWIEHVWKEGLKRTIHATDSVFNKYKCPIFYNLHITTSNILNTEKLKLKQLVDSNGGNYSGELKQQTTNILVLTGNPSSSKKFFHANSWGIPCVKQSWIHESIRKGYAVNTRDHAVLPEVRCSTPTKCREEAPSFLGSDISMVSHIMPLGGGSKSQINETASLASSTITNASAMFLKERKVVSKKAQLDDSYKKMVDNLNVAEAKTAGSFLDGCNVYLSGFTTQEQDKLRRILNFGGAIIFQELTDSVTHVVSGDFVAADANAISKATNKPYVVSVDWLVASLTQKSPAVESLYCRLVPTNNQKPIEPPSPLSQKGMQLLKKEFKMPTAVNDNTQNKNQETQQPPITLLEADSNKNVVNRNLLEDFLREDVPMPAYKASERNQPPSKSVQPESASNGTRDEYSVGSANMTEEESELYKGLDFMILGFDHDITTQIEEQIQKNGGKVVTQNYKGMIDYTIVPVNGFSVTGIQSEVITPYWHDDCVQAKSVLPIQYYHQPMLIAGDKTPLKGCIVTLSIYTFMERQFLAQLAGALGAICQETLVRKTNVKKGLQGCTHLIIPTGGSSKYNAAIKWKIPVVTKDWLLACAKLGTRCSETQFLVNETESTNVQPNLESTSESSKKSSNMEQVTPGQPSKLPNVEDTSNSSKRNPPSAMMEVTPGNLSKMPNVETPNNLSKRNSPSSMAEITSGQLSKKPNVEDINNSAKKKILPTVEDALGQSTKTHSYSEAMTKKVTSAGSISSTSPPTNERNINSIVGNTSNSPSVVPQNVDFQLEYHHSPKFRKLSSSTSTPVSAQKFKSMKTPETPYEEAFGETGQTARKRYKQRIDKVDALRDKSPVQVIHQRRNSTPLSELLRRGFRTFGNTENSFNESNKSASHIDEDRNEITGEAEVNEESHCPSQLMQKMETINRRLSTPVGTPVAEQLQRPLLHKKLSTSCDSPTDGETSSSSSVGSRLKMNQSLLSQKNEIGWEDPIESAEKGKFQSVSPSSSTSNSIKERKFVLSNIQSRKEEYANIVIALGGVVLNATRYTDDVTHLVTEQPVRNEKLLCSISAGKWILHVSYLEKSQKANMFLPEEDFEWGNPRSQENILPLKSNIEKKLAKAAFRWRRHVEDSGGNSGAYAGMKAVLLVTSKNLFQHLTSLVLAGKGVILNEKSILEATHCFIDDVKHPTINTSEINFEVLAALNIYCLPPIYLCDTLIENVKPLDCCLEEYKKFT